MGSPLFHQYGHIFLPQNISSTANIGTKSNIQHIIKLDKGISFHNKNLKEYAYGPSPDFMGVFYFWVFLSWHTGLVWDQVFGGSPLCVPVAVQRVTTLSPSSNEYYD
jgi:hypothetical protein